jgi:hypothetical protein
MPRRAATVEYLERLVEWAGGRPSLCRKTGIAPQNLAAYLNGSKSISWKRLRTATAEVFGEPPAFQPVVEGYDLRVEGLPDLPELPREPGIYGLFDSAMRALYFGKATSLYAEVRQTLGRRVGEVRPWTGAKNLTFREVTAYLSAYRMIRGDAKYLHDVEAFGLRFLVNNTFNKNGGTFKRTE